MARRGANTCTTEAGFRELAEFTNGVLVDVRTRQMPFWNSSFLGSLASDHIRGRKNYVLELNAVLTLGAVERLLCEMPEQLDTRPMAAMSRLV